ncbi:hypothetical protein [Streptomyces aureoversilis]|uniref:Uncharacterized protein n=1 Tax=Streptomyces aureoversilis TaxID=67277 RepID=A0ABW0A0R4_9ACTN
MNFGTLIGQVIQAAVRIHRGQPLPHDWVDEQLVGYVPPRNEGEAAAILRREKVLVLVADAVGTGRWTTALKLLRHYPDGALTIRPVRREAGDDFTMEGLRGQERTGWILDLRATGESVPVGRMFGRELNDTAPLKSAESVLIVLVSTELWKQIGEGAGNLDVAMDPADPAEILTAYLGLSDACPDPDKWKNDHRLKAHVRHLLPGQVYEWARTIVEVASDQSGSGSSETPEKRFTKQVEAVINARLRWFEQLAEWHSRPGRTSFERNYLLSMAVYDGSVVEDVHEKVALLATAFEEDAEPLRGQQGPGLVELTRQIDAKLQPDGSIRFPGPGFAEAVVDYFWLDRPHLLDKFTKWTVDQCLALEQPHQSALAERVTPWVLHHCQSTRSTRFLRSVATRWSENSRLLSHAVNLLVATSLDAQIGSLTRNAITKWIEQPKTTVALKCAITKACQHLAPVHPTSMLRRLAELAATAEPEVGVTVGESINALWDDSELRPRLHEALTNWLESEKPTVQRAAGNAFLHLAMKLDDTGMPTLLSDDKAPIWVVNSWRSILEADDLSSLALRVSTSWLDASAVSPEAREIVADVFVRAVHDTPKEARRGIRALNFFRIAENWRILGRALDEPTRNQERATIVERVEAADPRTVAGPVSAGGA